MPRASILIPVFVVSFLTFIVWLAPAGLVIDRLGAIPAGPGRLQLSQPSGRIWDGRAAWRWQRLAGQLEWALDWRGLTPGVRLTLREQGGQLRLQGWFGALSGDVSAADVELKLPVELVTEALPHGGADGYVSGRVEELVFTGEGFRALSGELRYSGGQVRWGRNGSARVPALDGRLFMDGGRARALVTGPDGQQLAAAGLGDGELQFRVFRAWPALLGESEGGNPDDVVFEVTRPLDGSGGGKQ